MARTASGVRTARSKGRSAPGPTRSSRTKLLAAVAIVLVAVVAVVWAINRSSGNESAPATIDHVHGLGVDPADGVLYVAAHNGVFRLPSTGPAVRVGDGQQDTMGFAVVGPHRFLASGHPAHGHGGPAHLGLIESLDAGVTWQTLSLSGAADFHALRYRHDTVYGYNSTNGQLVVSRDRTNWQTRATLALRDFAVSPSSPDTLLATTQSGLMRSTDGGRAWLPVGGPAVVLLDWERVDRLWALDAAGGVRRSADAGATWADVGKIGGVATAFAATGDDLYAAVNDSGIVHSRDGGGTWTPLHA